MTNKSYQNRNMLRKYTMFLYSTYQIISGVGLPETGQLMTIVELTMKTGLVSSPSLSIEALTGNRRS